MVTATEEFLAWSGTLKPWQQDALRRLVGHDTLPPEDEDEVLRILKAEHGINSDPLAPKPLPLKAEHLPAAGTSANVRIKAIANVTNTNQLLNTTTLSFTPDGISAIYGENGSGKSGFMRILRNACRSRITSSDGKRVPILANIYSDSSTDPAGAELHVSVDGTDQVIQWRDGEMAPNSLAHIAVFDSQAAQLYVDDSNHIAFLPYNLDLFFKLNILCTTLKTRLDKEQQELKTVLKATLSNIDPVTSAGKFLAGLSATTTLEDVEAALRWTDDHKTRAEELARLLDNPAADAASLDALAMWVEARVAEVDKLEKALRDDHIQCLREAVAEARAARQASDDAANGAFAEDYLPGVASETWRRMYQAAREYSTTEAYQERPFPVIEDGARCVFCQQELDVHARKRLQCFEAFVSGALARQAEDAEAKAALAIKEFSSVAIKFPDDYQAQIAQLELHAGATAKILDEWLSVAGVRHSAAVSALSNGRWDDLAPLSASVVSALQTTLETLRATAATIKEALKTDQRKALLTEQDELKAREKLAVLRAAVLRRIDDLKLDATLKSCSDATGTTAITRRAGEFSEKHLTPQVKTLLDEEIKALNLTHLNPTLQRKSDRKNAHFKVELKPGLKCRTSDILSEGEHRALALASFLAEVRSISDTTPIVIDDPVSSLDHKRSVLVAQRLAREAKQRQVIVFTHSLVFLHHLSEAAERIGVEPKCTGIFRTSAGTGHVDAAGEPWAGKPVNKRINVLKDRLPQIRKLANSSPEAYGIEVKGLYGRMRDCWERLIEEKLFYGVVARFEQAIQTTRLRYVEVSDDLYQRIEAGMTKTSTYSHDNPAAETAAIPQPDEIGADIAELEAALKQIEDTAKLTEKRRKEHLLQPAGV